VLHDMAEMIGESDVTLSVSNNGWTTNQLGVAWLKHFIKHTGHKRTGAYILLLLDGHGSHATIDFVTLAYDNNIVLLY
jgi:hypothetical protein